MSTRPKFDPARLTSLLNQGNEESRGVMSERAPSPSLASVPTESEEASIEPAVEMAPAIEIVKRPVTVRLTEEVLHALMRHQAEVRCKPGARLGDTTIGGVIDTLLRGPLGLS